MNPDERALLMRQRRIARTPEIAIDRHEPAHEQGLLFPSEERNEMVRCPQCGRKIDAVDPIPDHENYMKTARCPASGRRHDTRPAEIEMATRARLDELTAILGDASLLRRRKERR